MGPMVCRLKVRKGEPIGLTIYPGPTFVSLPLEIRNKIYGSLLITSEPVIVYSKPLGKQYGELPESHLKVAALTLGLLRVNKMISDEAAAVFYHNNVFKFGGSHYSHLVDAWDPLYSFLLTIGDRNRAKLQYLEAEISRPRAVTKDTDGTISSLVEGSFWRRKVHARDQHARIYPPVNDQQYLGPSVDYISPAIEAVFRIMGSSGPKLQLLLILELGDLPGIIVSESSGMRFGWSGEVPDYIERMRKRFTSPSSRDGARVEVLWKGTFFKSEFPPRVGRIEQDGWDVLEIQDIVGPVEENDFGRMGPMIYVTFQRKEPRFTPDLPLPITF